MKNVLAYCRPWNADTFTRVTKASFEDANVVVVSEHLGVDQTGYADSLSRHPSDSVTTGELFTEGSIRDVVARCRYLRSVNFEMACGLVERSFYEFELVLSKVAPLAVVSLTVDSYHLHVLALLCEKKGIPFIGLVPSFVPGFFRLSNFGPSLLTRDVSDEEVDQLYAKLTEPKFLPDYVSGAVRYPWKTVLKERVKQVARILLFSTLGCILPRYRTYHYLQARSVSRLNLGSIVKHVRGRHRDGAASNFMAAVEYGLLTKCGHDPKVFLPLQYFPESTVDYWVDDLAFVDYYNALFSLIESGVSTEWLVKEHPAARGGRPRGFLKALGALSRVTFIDSQLPISESLKGVDAVFVWTGTVGVEAALRGLPVICAGEPWYFDSRFMINVVDAKLNSGDVVDTLLKIDGASVQLRKEFLKGVLSKVLPGRFDVQRDSRRVMGSDDIKQIAHWIGVYYESYFTK